MCLHSIAHTYVHRLIHNTHTMHVPSPLTLPSLPHTHTHTHTHTTHTPPLSHTLLLSSSPPPFLPCTHLSPHTSSQYPLNADDYKDLIEEIKNIAENLRKSLEPLPPAQLDPLDLTGKIAPCCNQATDCTCSQPPNGIQALFNHVHMWGS